MILVKSNEEYRALLAKEFPRYSLDLGLCSPRSLNLTEAQFIKLIRALTGALAPYSYLFDLPLLILTLQAVTIEPGALMNQLLVACIDVFTPYSTNKMVCFEAQILSEEITLKQTYLRPFSGIRRSSLFGESHSDQKNSDKTALVFVVDDNAIVLKTISRMLIQLNPALTLRTFNDGSEVIQAYSNIKTSFFATPKLIFMDIQMPITDGFEATKAIRYEERKNQLERSRIVALTAQAIDASDAINQIGFDAVLTKPFNNNVISDQLMAAGLVPHQINENPEFDPKENSDSDDESTAGIIEYLNTNCNIL